MNAQPPRDENAVFDPQVHDTLLNAIRDESPPERLRKRVMDRIRGSNPANFVTIREEDGAWESVVPGIDIKRLHREGTYHSFLLRLRPGAKLPAHHHGADEECLVLQGETRMGDIVLKTGDYHLAPQGVPHATVTSDCGALLFIRARLTDYVMPR